MKAFSQFTEESLYQDLVQAIISMTRQAQITCHETADGICVVSWRNTCGDRYCLEAVWQDGGPHLTLFVGTADVDNIIASMTCDEQGYGWPECAAPAFQVFCAAVKRME